MSNTYKIPYTRNSKRGVSDLMSITAISAAMSQAESLMINSNWIPVSNLIADLPLHSFTQSGFQDGFDAATFCGDYASARQRAYACAICYTIKIPNEALAGSIAEITSITASLYGDRWASAGAIIAAIPSAFATPPAWSAVLSATATSPDPVTEKDDADPTWQAPLRKITRSNDQFNVSGEPNDHACTVTIPIAVAATPYLHIILRMGDYATHAGAWIEGGVMLDGTSLAVTFDRAVTLDDPSDAIADDLRLPVRAVANAQTVEFLGSNGSLRDSYLRMHWGLRMLVGGRISESSTTPYTSASSVTTLTPQLKLNGLNTIMRGCIVECYCARKELSGYNLYLSLSSNCIGTSPFRISVIAATDQPDITLADTWGGILAGCIGTAIFSGGSLGDTLTIPITANPTSTRLWIVASLVDIAEADTAAISLGFTDYLGISVEDAHIAAKPLDVSYSAPTEGLKSYAHSSTSSGLIFDLLRNEEVAPYQFEQLYAINSNGAASKHGTTYGAWKLLGSVDPVSTLPGSTAYICAGNGFFLAHSYNNIYYSGDISSLDDTIAFTPKAINALAVAYDGFITANSDNTVTCHGTACLSLLNASVGTWTGVGLIISSGVTGALGAFKCVALKTDGTLLTYGYDASAKSTLEGLTGVAWVVLSNIMTVILKTDGSAIVYKGVSPSFKTVTAVSQSWTNIQTIGAARNAAFCVNGASPPYSVSILTDAGATTLDWFDPTTLPSGRSPAFIIGSDYSRLALGYTS